MEVGFVKAQSDNLPIIDAMMLAIFFANNPDFIRAEIKGKKLARSARESYGDIAVGYVQLKREGDLCIVRGKITPEHSVRKAAYNVTVTIDEKEEEIQAVQCEDCAASLGGCKHAVAFITWIHRRSEEPSKTSVECYWKKSQLSAVGTSLKFLTLSDMAGSSVPVLSTGDGSFLSKIERISKEINRTDTVLTKYFGVHSEVEKLSLHYQLENYRVAFNNYDCNDFFKYCKQFMPKDVCIQGSDMTTNQADNSLWHELRFGRITASKVYSVLHCKKSDGTVVESILGAYKIKDNAAMERGRRLEKIVLSTVSSRMNQTFEKCGLMLCDEIPIMGASPDAICDDYVVEIKCPATKRAFDTYITKNSEVAAKYKAQLQTQMHFYQKERALFCVAHEDFEETNNVTTIFVKYDKEYTEAALNTCTEFWKKHIFPILIK